MYRHILIASAAIALLAGGTALAQQQTPSPSPSQSGETSSQPAAEPATPQEFAVMAASSNMFEIESSRLALEKTQEDAVREFAQHMIDDHTKAGEEMKTAAQGDGVSEVPSTMDPRHQAMLTQLQNAEGDAFDEQYVSMQVAAHEEAVALFTSYSEKEGTLADFAEKTLPTLEEHLTEIQKLASQ